MQAASSLDKVSNTSNIDRSSLSSFKIKMQPTINVEPEYELLRKQSGPPQLGSRLADSMRLTIQPPAFSVGCASDTPHSAVSFSAGDLGGSQGTRVTQEEEKPEN